MTASTQPDTIENARCNVYHTVARSLTVAEIATPITQRLSPEQALEDVIKGWMLESEDDWFATVEDETHTYGYLAYDDLLSPDERVGCAKDRATPIIVDSLIPATTALLDLPSLFLKHNFYFLLSGNRVTHVVTFRDLDRLPARLALFSLFLELESTIIDLFLVLKDLSGNSDLEQYLAKLSPEQLKRAQKTCEKNRRGGTLENVLRATTFKDKIDILRQTPAIRDRLPLEDDKQYDCVFDWITKLRNALAHNDSILDIFQDPELLNTFIDLITQMILVLNEMKNEKHEEVFGY